MKFKRKQRQNYYKGKDTVRRTYSKRDKTYEISGKKVWKSRKKKQEE